MTPLFRWREMRPPEESGTIRLAEPLRIVGRAVEVVRGLVAFELAFASGLFCFGKKSGGLGRGQRLEIPRDIESLRMCRCIAGFLWPVKPM